MRGVSAAIVTQFDTDLAVDHGALRAQVTRLLDDGIQGIVAAGTMGEAASLTATERGEVIATAVSAAAGRAPVYAGISATTAAQAIAYARDAQAAGADGVMALPPLLYRGDEREIVDYFVTIAAATTLPMMIYNNPEASGTDMRPRLLREIVAAVPSAACIKECSGDARRIAELVDALPEIDILVGGDDWALEGCCAGARGWISGVCVALGAQCVSLWDLCNRGELAAARELYAEILPLARFDMTPKLVQYFKAALDELGLDGGRCRPPRLALTDSEAQALRLAVAHASSPAGV